jgi:hypothetical protein
MEYRVNMIMCCGGVGGATVANYTEDSKKEIMFIGNASKMIILLRIIYTDCTV